MRPRLRLSSLNSGVNSNRNISELIMSAEKRCSLGIIFDIFPAPLCPYEFLSTSGNAPNAAGAVARILRDLRFQEALRVFKIHGGWGQRASFFEQASNDATLLLGIHNEHLLRVAKKPNRAHRCRRTNKVKCGVGVKRRTRFARTGEASSAKCAWIAD